MFLVNRAVRFEEVDAASLVFFGRYFGYGHEALEQLCGALAGGYAGLIGPRHLGLPAVHVDADFTAPLRYGDTARIALEATRIGRTSATLRYTFVRASDGAAVATLHHTVVCCDLTTLKPVPLPDDLRALLEAHAAAPPP